MRNIINISLPAETRRGIEREVKAGEYASISEFFRDLLRSWKEGELLKEVEISRREIKEGKGKVLRSLKDLR